MTTMKKELKSGTLALIELLRTAHAEHSSVRKKMQSLFLKTFRSALDDVGGKYWHDAEGEELEHHFLDAKRLVWKELTGDFDRGVYDSYFSTIKKCLHYDVDDWAFCKRTSIDLLEKGLVLLKEKQNEEGAEDSFYEDEVNYQDGLKRAVNTVRKQEDENKEAQALVLAESDFGGRLAAVPTPKGRTDEEYANEAYIFIRRWLSHPLVQPSLVAKNGKGLQQILQLAEANVVEKKNGKNGKH